jgi:hypothetical protein
VKKLCGYLPDGNIDLYVPHENFHREIGTFKRQRYTVEGTLFQGSDEAWDTYISNHLPTAQDEEDLKEIFKQQWVAEKPLTARQIASGIGASV